MLTYKGTIKNIGNTINVSQKFTKREFVLTDNATSYPQVIQFQLTKDRCSLLDKFVPGDTVTVHFLLKGREWTSPKGETKVFNTLDVFRIEQAEEGNFKQETFTPIPDDDLPF